MVQIPLADGTRAFYAPPATAPDRHEDAWEIEPSDAALLARVDAPGATCSAGPALASFPATVSVEQHQIFDPGATAELRFPWTFAASGAGATVVPFDAPGYQGGPVTITVHLLGMSDFGINPEHHAVMAINGRALPDAEFGGLGEKTFGAALPAGSIQATGNTLSLTAVADLANVPYDLIGLSSIDLSYARSTRAAGDALHFSAIGGSVVELSGFTRAPVILDLTDPGQPVRIEPAVCGASKGRGPGPLEPSPTFRFQAPGAGLRTLYAAVARPAPLFPSRAHEVPPGSADWVAIVGDGLEVALDPLVALRQSQGLSTLTVPVSALYDRFAHGQHGTLAFQRYLAQLSPPPRDVLLVGRASLDPHDYLGTGTPDLVPTPIVITTDLQTVAAFDDGLVAGPDGRTPFAAVGRIPAASPEELEPFIAKLVAYEQGASGPSGRALFAADDQDPDGAPDAFFETESDSLAAQLTGDQIIKVYLPNQSTPDLLAGLSQAPDLVSYHGHADGLDWSTSGLLSAGDLSSFPAARPFLLITVDCWDGMFAMPTFEALAPQMVELGAGGAIAAFAASSLVDESNDPTLDASVFPLLQGSQPATIGEITQRAQTALAAVSGPGSELVRVYNLIGDPATRNPLY
jgi:hypothetical protein